MMEYFDRSEIQAALHKARRKRQPNSSRKRMRFIEQTSMMIFQMYIEDLEQEREAAARRNGTPYTPLVEQYRWDGWAAAGLNKAVEFGTC